MSFGSYLIAGISLSMTLVIVMVFIYLFYESFMEQKFRIAKLTVFLILSSVIYINYFYVAHFESEDLEGLCVANSKTSSANFLLSKEFRNCTLNEKFRDKLIEKNIKKWTDRENKKRDIWLSNFPEINQIFMGNVEHIGYNKFIKNTKLPHWSESYLENNTSLPKLIKVKLSDCNYDFGEKRYQFYCAKQILENNKEKEIGLSIDASKFPELDFLRFFGEETFDFYLSTHQIKSNIVNPFEFALLGLVITKEQINRNIDAQIKSWERYFKGSKIYR